MPSIIAPDILRELAELSWPLCACWIAIGLVLFLLGGYGHRFWLVLGTTLAAGVLGLQYGEQFGMQRLVAGLFVGLAAGVLALALMRIVAFLCVGAVAWWLAARFGWNEQLACFLVGGIIGVLLFRVWVMVLTSLFGTVLTTYAGLLLLGRYAGTDVAGLAERNGPLFNWAIAGVTLLGLVFQSLILRSFGGSGSEARKDGAKDKKKKSKDKDKDKDKDRDRDDDEDDRPREKAGWLSFLMPRKAG